MSKRSGSGNCRSSRLADASQPKTTESAGIVTPSIVTSAVVVRMSRQHVNREGKLSMSRQKTGVSFTIPLLPALVAELALLPKSEQLTFLLTESGRPFKNAHSFGAMFKRWCKGAGLPNNCTTHGLRKASAIRHALNGATAPELMASHGWKTIGEAQRYIEEANKIRLSDNAAAKMTRCERKRKGKCQTRTRV